MAVSLIKVEQMRLMMTERLQEREDRACVENHSATLKAMREFAGFSQAEMADLCDVRQSVISTLEGGKSCGIRRDVLRRILDVYDVLKEVVDGSPGCSTTGLLDSEKDEQGP